MNQDTQHTILVVDDDPASLKILFQQLRQSGFKVLTAEKGASALKRVARIKPDMVLLDVNLPDIDGFELFHHIQAYYPNEDIPVMFLTALSDIANKLKGLNLNAVDYLTKPFQAEEVVARVEKHIMLQHLRYRLEEKNAQLEREIAERQRVEEVLLEREANLKEAQRLARIGSWELDLLTGNLVWSEELYHIMQVEPETALHLDEVMRNLILPDDLEMAENAIQEAVATGELHPFEFRVRRKDGEERVLWCRGKVCYNPEGEPVKLVGIDQDITERKRMEEQLHRAKQDAEAANRAKSVFLTNMSHELRTPMNAILGFSQLLLRDSTLTGEQRGNLATIHRSGNHLLALINDVLEMSKIEAGGIELQQNTFDLYNLLLGLEEMFRLHTQQKGLTLKFQRAPDVPQYVRTDQNKLRQILINILGNAVKFTEKGGVTLRVSRMQKAEGGKQKAEGRRQKAESRKQIKWTNDDFEAADCRLPTADSSLSTVYLFFEVSDTGVGISPEELDHVFDAFVQTTSGQKSHQGTGLGMPISQRFIHMMEGEIAVKSHLGEGSTFLFEIPVENAGFADIQPIRKARKVVGLEPGQPTFRILIVEDERDNRKLLVQLLKPVGFDIREAKNGKEAMESWETWKPHLIWMDMRMPIIDGHEATKKIRISEAQRNKAARENLGGALNTTLQKTSIIALTAGAFEEQRAEALKSGCDDFVRKPVDEQEVFEKMQKFLGVRYVYTEGQTGEREKTSFLNGLRRASMMGSEGWEETDATKIWTSENIDTIPEELIAALEEAIEVIDMEIMTSVTAKIRTYHMNLADTLTWMANDFRYDEMVDLLQRVRNVNAKSGKAINAKAS